MSDSHEEPIDDVVPEPEGDDPDEGADQSDADVDGAEGDDAEESADDSTGHDRDEPEAAEEVDGEPPRRKSASDVIREQKRTRKESERRAEEAGRKADEALRRAEAAERRAEEAERRAGERRQQETAEAEAARVELMSDSERLAHYRQKDGEAHKREMDGVKFQIWDSTDRSEFRQLCREDAAVASVKEQVDSEYDRLRLAGRPVAREILANQFIAKKYRESRAKAGTKQRARAEAGVRREQVRPQRTRSDVAPQRTRRGEDDTREARARRLADVKL